MPDPEEEERRKRGEERKEKKEKDKKTRLKMSYVSRRQIQGNRSKGTDPKGFR